MLLMHVPLTEMFKVPFLEGDSFRIYEKHSLSLAFKFYRLSVRFLLIGDLNNFVNVFVEVSLDRSNVFS